MTGCCTKDVLFYAIIMPQAKWGDINIRSNKMLNITVKHTIKGKQIYLLSYNQREATVKCKYAPRGGKSYLHFSKLIYQGCEICFFKCKM